MVAAWASLGSETYRVINVTTVLKRRWTSRRISSCANEKRCRQEIVMPLEQRPFVAASPEPQAA